MRLWGIWPTMREGVLVVFHLPAGSTPAQHRTFRRKVYGEETSSWSGRYRYHRKGLLDEIPCVRLYWGVIIVRKKDSTHLSQVMREMGGQVEMRRVRLSPGDEKSLGLSVT